MPFRDHFSRNASDYSKYRPRYPDSLFDALAELAPSRGLAWDCGTGSGQAALALAQRFRKVVATDASPEQIRNAPRHPGVEYRVEPAETTSLEPSNVDLTTAGTAAHWFDFDRFYAEVRRVGKPSGVVALWTYHFPVIHPEVDREVDRVYWETLDGYWPERIRYLEEHYRTLPFPFEEIPLPGFEMGATWVLDDMLGFVSSWSAVRRYVEANGPESFSRITQGIADGWGAPDRRREIAWPLYVRVGRLPG